MPWVVSVNVHIIPFYRSINFNRKNSSMVNYIFWNRSYTTMERVKHYAWLLKAICLLDIRFLFISSLPFGQRMNFLVKKYTFLFKNSLLRTKLTQYKTIVLGEKIFFDNKYSLISYQSLFVTAKSFFKYIKKNEIFTVIDVGANLGFFSKTVRHFFPSSKIYAIEPVPSVRTCLEENFKNDKLLKSVGVALSNKQGSVRMSTSGINTQNSMVSNSGNLVVPATTLNMFTKKNYISQIDLLKIDTETFEAHVLRGGDRALAITKYLLLEVNLVNNNDKYTFSSLIALLFSKNYNFQLIKIKNYSQNPDRDELFDCLFINTYFDR